jgi:hypothetical protein
MPTSPPPLAEPQPTVLERIFLEAYPPTHAFAIISWGAAATSWLARALNAHPDIYCVHAANQFWHALGRAPYLDGVEYLRVIASQGYAHRIAGDIHGISRHLVPALRKTFPGRFKSAVLIRDPYPRLRSQFAHFDRFKQYRTYDVSYIDAVIDNLGLDVSHDDYDRKLYVHGVNMLNAIVEEVEMGPVFTSESVTSDPLALKKLIVAIADEGFEVDDAWCEQTVHAQRVNRHQRSSADPLAQPWLQEIIRKVVQPRAWELYAGFGYSGWQ